MIEIPTFWAIVIAAGLVLYGAAFVIGRILAVGAQADLHLANPREGERR